ncbi:MAG: DUF488 domain-containing protein [Anaerolineales bacterium]|nr:DUF488 domain-containing protein [Anaerolineales bacterium]
MSIKLKRVYEAAAASDGYRVLVDRLWPRGLKKEAAAIDLWLKEIGPSTELRHWFGHEPEKFPQFSKLYKAELKTNPAVAELRALAKQHKTITLLYGARDTEHNQAVVLQEFLEK